MIKRYQLADKFIKELNTYFIKEFNKTKYLAKFDELNVINYSKDLYKRIYKKTKEYFILLAKTTYLMALNQVDGKTPDDTVSWFIFVRDFFNRYDPVTKYQFKAEVDRKRQRFAESIIASNDISKDTDTALKYWSNMVKQYGDELVDEATLKAYKDAGIKYVKWVTAKDEKVCELCREYDGMVFKITDIPDKPHYGCRCDYLPVRSKDYEKQ